MGDILFGTAGWSYEDWKGRVYPPHPGSRFDPLAYLARYFDLVEVNVSFYRLPRPETVSSWIRRVEDQPDFTFMLKGPAAWTHPDHAGLAEGRSTAEEFRRLAEILAEVGRLGAVLLQFPWSLRDGRLARERIAGLLDRLAGLPVAVEVRHGDFAGEDWPRWLLERGALPVNVDQPLIGSSLPLTRWRGAGASYFRLHGRNEATWFDRRAGRDARYDYLYGDDELRELAAAITDVARDGPPVFVVANNHYLGQAPVVALQLKAHFAGSRIPLPPSLLPHYPPLASIALAENGGQGDLFG
jgi:uncharacterized protein YecE (DUF72 family)